MDASLRPLRAILRDLTSRFTVLRKYSQKVDALEAYLGSLLSGISGLKARIDRILGNMPAWVRRGLGLANTAQGSKMGQPNNFSRPKVSPPQSRVSPRLFFRGCPNN